MMMSLLIIVSIFDRTLGRQCIVGEFPDPCPTEMKIDMVPTAQKATKSKTSETYCHSDHRLMLIQVKRRHRRESTADSKMVRVFWCFPIRSRWTGKMTSSCSSLSLDEALNILIAVLFIYFSPCLNDIALFLSLSCFSSSSSCFFVSP